MEPVFRPDFSAGYLTNIIKALKTLKTAQELFDAINQQAYTGPRMAACGTELTLLIESYLIKITLKHYIDVCRQFYLSCFRYL